MSILSLGFFIFVIAALIFYYTAPGKSQWLILLAVSYVFYFFAGVKAVVFILITTFTTFFAGIKIGQINDEYEVEVKKYSEENIKLSREEKKQIKAEEDKRKKRIAIGVLVLNFGILIALKYMTPVVNVFNWFCGLLHIDYEVQHFSFLIPLGISYYTFQAAGYIIDLYRRKYAPEKRLGYFMLFISFFPQLIQGPVSRFDEFAHQLVAPHPFDFNNIKRGMTLSAWGLFKKLVLSDRIAIMVGTIFSSPETYGGAYILVGTILSTLRLYTDFSGGIDITRGVAEMFGVSMPENFTRPFFSINLAEYWRRWHITMNTWWRDYIFYPLTLSRSFQKVGKSTRKTLGENFSKKLPILISVIIIRLINAVWHGAAASDMVGGLYHGVLLALSFYFEPHIIELTKKLKIKTDCLSWRIFQCARTFLIVAAPKIITSPPSFSDGLYCIKSVFTVFNPWVLFDGSMYKLGVSQSQVVVVGIGFLVLLLVSAIQETGRSVRDELEKQNIAFRCIIYVLLLFSIILFGVYGSGYDASAFIYQLI